MASSEHIDKLRTKLNDKYSKDGSLLVTASQAFTDDELNELIDDAALEASEGAVTGDNLSDQYLALAIIVARADGLLMLAQDEARRIKWDINNKVVDPTMSSANLRLVAKELRERYRDHKKRELDREIAGVENRPTGALMNFNTTVDANSERSFDNRTVNRNRSPDH